MKIVSKDFVRDGPGSVKIEAEDSDDLWFTYNLIAPGDRVMAMTSRKIQREKERGKDSERARVRGKESERVRLKLEVQVEDVDYDKDGDVLRIHGKNVLVNEHVEIGSFHTVELEPKRRFVLRKKIWDSLAIDTLKQAKDHASSGDVAVVLMQEGFAQIFPVGTSVRARIETSIPNRKHASYESALKKFFDNVVQAFVNHVDFSVVSCVVIASPGFTKDQFHRHLLLEAERRHLRAIIENKSRIVLVHTNSGSRHGLKEVLQEPKVVSMIKDTKAAEGVKALNDFFIMFDKDPYRVCYGPKHVEFAHERMAIQTLLITDELFRNYDVRTRKKYVDFVESVKKLGGEAFVFSSMHVSGEQLAKHTGIAALLRFPLPELDDIQM